MNQSNNQRKEHQHSWWHLITITSGIVYKCDCGELLEPRPWWKFWGKS